jgi:hypothetical protein
MTLVVLDLYGWIVDLKYGEFYHETHEKDEKGNGNADESNESSNCAVFFHLFLSFPFRSFRVFRG